MEVLGVIPARGGSKGIPHKNIYKICNIPLIQYTFDAANEARLLSRVVVSTDDIDIANYSKEKQIEVIERPDYLATDDATTADTIRQVLNYLKYNDDYEPDYVMILQPTSPLRTGIDIDKAIELIVDNPEADSVVSVVETPHSNLPEKQMYLENGWLKFNFSNGESYTTRQKMRKTYSRNGAAIYLFKEIVFLKTGSFYGTRILPYFMNKINSIDIDDYEDVFMAEAIIRYR